MFTTCLKIPDPISDEHAQHLAEAMSEQTLSFSALREDRKHQNPWVLEWLSEEPLNAAVVLERVALQAAVFNIKPLTIDIKNFSCKETPQLNWLEQAYEDFKPFSIGPFFIYGSHYKGDIPAAQIALQVDAATAFGSGEHETTKGCMQAMLDLKGQGACPWNILDMGTGSGILALAAWKLWKSPTLAVDNDPESIVVTKRHAALNGVALAKSALSCACGDGFNTPIVGTQKPYELILANILAGPVIEMAPALHAVLDDNGYCILSGMLKEQADLVASAYEGLGLTLHKRYDIGEWSTLVLQRR